MFEVYSGRSFLVTDAVSWLGRHFGHRIIMTVHGGAMPEFMSRFPDWTRRVMSRADIVVAPSPFMSRALSRHGFQARTVPNVIELSAHPYRRRAVVRPHMLWMRSFHAVYNPLMAIRVVECLSRRLPNASLVMAGQNKGLEGAARELAEQLGVNRSVRFAGFLDAARKAAEGNLADIFVNTNQVDNMPVAILEAWAMGLPVVSTAVGGVPDLVTDGETGLLVPDGDVEAMAAAITRLVEEPGLAERLSSNGRKRAEQVTWEAVRPQWEAVFADALSE